MSMPRGDTPEKVNDFYLYLNGHQQTTHPVQTWHVDWMSLAWLWGFASVLIVILLLWVKQSGLGVPLLTTGPATSPKALRSAPACGAGTSST